MSVILQKLMLALQSPRLLTLLFLAGQVVVANLLASALVRQPAELRLMVWQCLAFALLQCAAVYLFQFVSAWKKKAAAVSGYAFAGLASPGSLQLFSRLCYFGLSLAGAAWILYFTAAPAGYKAATALWLMQVWLAFSQHNEVQQSLARAAALALSFLIVFLNFLNPPELLMWFCCGLILVQSLLADLTASRQLGRIPLLVLPLLAVCTLFLHQLSLRLNQTTWTPELLMGLLFMVLALAVYGWLTLRQMQEGWTQAATQHSAQFRPSLLGLVSGMALEVTLLALLAPQYGSLVVLLMVLIICLRRPGRLALSSG